MTKIQISLVTLILFHTNFILAQTKPLLIDLNIAMQMDEEHSFSVKLAQSEKTNAESQKFFAITQLGPSISTTGTMSWYDKTNLFNDASNTEERTNSLAWSVTATQPLVGLIPETLKIEKNEANLEANTQDLLAAKINARLEGATAYILVQQNLRTLEAKKSATKFAEETYKQAQVLFNTGSVEKTKIEVLQTRAEAANARLDQASTQKDLQTALSDLATKIGVGYVQMITVPLEETSLWERMNPKIPNINELIKQAISSRPEIFSAEEKYTAAKLNIAQNSFNYFPQVNLFATYTKQANDYNTSFPNNSLNEFTYGLNLNWSVWDGGVQAAEIADNINSKSKAFFEKEKIVETVTQDVRNAFNALQSAIKSLEDAKDAAQSYENSYKLAMLQYKTGDYNTISLIEMQNKMTAAQVTLANIRSNLDLFWIQLQAALGQLPRAAK